MVNTFINWCMYWKLVYYLLSWLSCSWAPLFIPLKESMTIICYFGITVLLCVQSLCQDLSNQKLAPPYFMWLDHIRWHCVHITSSKVISSSHGKNQARLLVELIRLMVKISANLSWSVMCLCRSIWLHISLYDHLRLLFL